MDIKAKTDKNDTINILINGFYRNGGLG